MQRQFHAPVTLRLWALIAVLAFLTVYAAWERAAIVLAVGLVLLIAVVERAIHTTYTVTSDSLVVSEGRFARKVIIPLAAIERIDRVTPPARLFLRQRAYLVIVHSAGRQTAVRPTDEDRFVETLRQRHDAI